MDVVALRAGALAPVAPEAELPQTSLILAALLKPYQSPSSGLLLSDDLPQGRAVPAAFTRRCLTDLAVYILTLSLKPEGLVTPMRHPRVNVSDCLEVLAMTEMSSPNKTNELMRRDESLQVPGGCGSGSALLLKQPLCRQALKLQG